MAYVTLTEVKQLIGRNLDNNTKEDDLLNDLIARVQDAIDAYCSGRTRKRTFEAIGDTVRTFNALGDVIGTTLFLHADLAQTPTTVSNNGTPVLSANYKLLCDAPPHNAPYTRIKLLSSEWAYTSTPEDAISITGRFAYSVTAPEDVKQAAVRLITAVFRQRDSLSNVDRATVSMDGTLFMPDGMPKDVCDLLEPYVIRG